MILANRKLGQLHLSSTRPREIWEKWIRLGGYQSQLATDWVKQVFARCRTRESCIRRRQSFVSPVPHHPQDLQISLGTRYQLFFGRKTPGLEMAGTGNEGNRYQLQCAISAVQPGPSLWAVEKRDPWQSCRLLKPLPAHGAHRAPRQKPTHS